MKLRSPAVLDHSLCQRRKWRNVHNVLCFVLSVGRIQVVRSWATETLFYSLLNIFSMFYFHNKYEKMKTFLCTNHAYLRDTCTWIIHFRLFS